MIILGIDPSLTNTGWGVIFYQGQTLRFIASGTIKTNASLKISHRLRQIHEKLLEIIKQYQPDCAAMEESFINNNAASSIKLAQARGAIMLTIALSKIELTEYAPTLIKKTVAGAGRAEKNQIQTMIKLLLPNAVVDSEHASDALAIGVCHSRFINSAIGVN